MVYTKVNRVKDLGRKLGYIKRAEKTDGGRYVSMFGIKGDEPGREFMDTVRDSGRERERGLSILWSPLPVKI